MKKIILNDIEYEVVKEYRDGFEEEPVIERATDYFNDFDYIFGDWAYGKLRLKGLGLTKSDNTKGDLEARIKVIIPENPNEQVKELYRKLKELNS